PCSVEAEEAGRVHLDDGVGELLPGELEIGEVLSEELPALRVRERLCVGAPRDSDADHPHRDAARVQELLRVLETCPLVPEEGVLCSDTALFEPDLRRARAAHPELLPKLDPDLQAWIRCIDEERSAPAARRGEDEVDVGLARV